ncbi:RNase H family protein [uncultured Desulfobacter sp.]|uniref:ribonuclease HI n=1 Tax=uncultured Desulfobacter sp. TaxID=240139 RepID=UPI0029C74ABB|nr:RNase H family protein [uncultured Desulfobacter sp.]
MTILRLFTDGSVNPKSNVGYGAYLAVLREMPYSESFKADVKVKKFEHTSSAKLELQALIWALTSIQKPVGTIIVYTDSQNIIGLKARRKQLEINDYLSKKNKPIKNSALYKEFFYLSEQLDCEFKKVKGHKPSRLKNEAERFFTLVDKASRRALRKY